MKNFLFCLLIVLALTACSSTVEGDKDIVAEDGTIFLTDCAQYHITSDMLGPGRGILEYSNNSKLALVEDASGPNTVFYRFDLEKATSTKLCEIPYTVIASGDDLFVDDRYYYFSNCSTDDIRIIYRLDVENGNLEVIYEHQMESQDTHSDSPFIYFSRFDDERFLWVEMNLDSSQIKLYNTKNGSIETIVSYPNVPASEAEVSSFLVDTYAYNSRIYALVARKDLEKYCYQFVEFDETGRELGIYELGDFEIVDSTSYSAPLSIKGSQNYITVRHWDGSDAVYKLNPEQHSVEKIIDKMDGFSVFISGMQYNYKENSMQYIFMVKDDINENVLYALDTETGKVVSKSLIADTEHPYLNSGILEADQSLLLSFVSLNDEGYKNEREKIYYHLSAEAVGKIFTEIDP